MDPGDYVQPVVAAEPAFPQFYLTHSPTVTATGGADLIVLGGADDIVPAGSGADTVDSGGGQDMVYGAGGNDLLNGGAGDDWLWGGSGPDRLFGGEGDDVLSAGINFGYTVDGLFGEAGDDTLFGSQGFDRLFGGSGDDWLEGKFNADVFAFSAGHGHDVIADFAATNRFEKIDFSEIPEIASLADVVGIGGRAQQEGDNVGIITGAEKSGPDAGAVF